MANLSSLGFLTQGLLRDANSATGAGVFMLGKGLPVKLGPLPKEPADVRRVTTPTLTKLGAHGNLVELPDATPIIDANGNRVFPLAPKIDAGDGRRLSFDPGTGEGLITPTLMTGVSRLQELLDDGLTSYTGSDCRVLIELANQPAGVPRCAKQLFEVTTLTVSVHRVKSPVPAAGFINTKGFSRGRRTIAGTIVMTKFTTEVLYRFLRSGVITDLSKDTQYTKIDQLPPFNLTLLFADEFGHASYQRLLGVEFVTDGSVYSIQDMLTEQTISYMAADFTPLLPLGSPSFYLPAADDPSTRRDPGPASRWRPK